MRSELYYREDSRRVRKYLIIFIVLLIIGVLGFLPELFTGLFIGFEFFLVSLMMCVLWGALTYYSYKKYMTMKKVRAYYQSDAFWNIKNEIKDHVQKCNELNEHIEELKMSFVQSDKNSLGTAEYIDNSNYNFKRKEWEKLQNDDKYVHQCSASVCKNAQAQPFKYLGKYFGMKANNDTLNRIEEVFNNFSAVEEGKSLLNAEEQEMFAGLYKRMPDFTDEKERPIFTRRLGFKDIDFSDVYYPRFKFLYVSPGGNSSTETNITLDLENLADFIQYLSEQVKFKESAKGQRALMTSKLREHIKQRDNYTCQCCGVSVKDEPHLLLEIDHIVPVSKGGKTEESNLQTLCWQCNRKKGNKLA